MDFLTEHYAAIKFLHILTAVTSISLFSYRFALQQYWPQRLDRPWVKLIPHLNDSLLLLLAVLLCLVIRQAPGMTPWLSEKVLFVVLYILAGMYTFRRAKTRPAQIIWFIIAVSMFVYTANIAINKAPLIL